jgi:hypothetical protein
MGLAELQRQLTLLHHDWGNLSLVEQDRQGADYAIRAIQLAERIMAITERYADMALERFDQSQ